MNAMVCIVRGNCGHLISHNDQYFSFRKKFVQATRAYRRKMTSHYIFIRVKKCFPRIFIPIVLEQIDTSLARKIKVVIVSQGGNKISIPFKSLPVMPQIVQPIMLRKQATLKSRRCRFVCTNMYINSFYFGSPEQRKLLK